MLDINNKGINLVSTKSVTDINFTNMPDHITVNTISLDLTTGTTTDSDNNLNPNSLPFTFGNNASNIPNLYNNLDTISFSGSDVKIIYASTAKTLIIPDGETLTMSEEDLSSTAIDIVLEKNAKVNLPNEFIFINSYHDKMTLNDIKTLLTRTTSCCTEHAKILSNTDNSTLGLVHF